MRALQSPTGAAVMTVMLSIALASSCKKDDAGASPAAASESSTTPGAGPTRTDAGATDGEPVMAGGHDASAGGNPGNSGSIARASWSGEATGQGAEPPIHEYVHRVTADPWTATGTLRLDVPAADGPVSGTLELGGLTFRVNGFRTGAHVRGTMEQSGGDPGAAGPDERGAEFYRGTLDAEVSGDTIRGTWEASAQAGMHRRRGTVTAHR